MGNKEKKEKKLREKYLQKKKKAEETKLIIQSLSKEHFLDSKSMDQLTSIQSLSRHKPNPKHLNPIEQEKKVEETPKIQQESVNIFQQTSFVNENKIEFEAPKQIINKNYTRSTTELEIEAKKLYPELNFETFEQTKKKQEEQDKMLYIENLEDQVQEEDTSSDISDIEDEDLKSLVLKQEKLRQKNVINRTDEFDKQRQELPIYMKESEIVEAINNNLVSIICGETGSGKSTQVPQFLYEAGYSHPKGPNPGLIAITQPRRLATISLAKRLSDEMNEKLGDTIAYQVRHDATSQNDNTRIKFLTDGILLNEMSSNFLLSQYSVIIIDEAHERKINTDLLLGLLTRIINIRLKLSLKNDDVKPLRLIIMSATLRVSEFTENKFLFKKKQIPVINVENRQFPVQIHYNKQTPENYLEEAIKKTTKIHTKLPLGHILVFLTGEKEIKEFCYKIKRELDSKQQQNYIDSESSQNEDDSQFEIEEEEGAKENTQKQFFDYVVYPLYSKLPMEEQQAIFKHQNPEQRMIVVSTNVAETSVTIPNVKYVVDAGKEKKKNFSQNLSISQFSLAWISQASANQRSGRAGRTGPGHCYRLYSTSVFTNLLEQFSAPEILGVPLENVVLQLKQIGIENVSKFPFPTPPDKNQISKAIQNLIQLQALVPKEQYNEMKGEDLTDITELGKILAYIPLAPKFSKMLLMTRQFDCLGFGLLLVSSLSVDEIFQKQQSEIELVEESESDGMGDSDKEEDDLKFMVKFQKLRKKKKQALVNQKRQEKNIFIAQYKDYMQDKSDLFLLVNIVGDFIKNLTFQPKSEQTFNTMVELDKKIYKYAQEHKLISKSLKEIYYNLQQLLMILDSIIVKQEERDSLSSFFNNYKQPSSFQQSCLQECIIATFITKIARKIVIYDENKQPKLAYETFDTFDKHAFIQNTSVLFKCPPDFLAYTDLVQTHKLFLRNCTAVDNQQLLYKYDMSHDKKIEYQQMPIPIYSKKLGKLLSYAKGKFGAFGWELNGFWTEFEQDSIEKYYHFARVLLEGQILDFFKALQKFYIVNPKTIKLSNINPIVTKLVNIFRNNSIDNEESLKKKWEEDKEFLLDEIVKWVKPEICGKIKKKWPPL